MNWYTGYHINIYLVVFNRLLVCRKPLDKVYSEYVVNKVERESNQQTFKKTIDIVYIDHQGRRRFCFELKNIRVEDLNCGKNYSKNYDKLKEISDEIAQMDPKDVLNLHFKPENERPKWFPLVSTVGEFMEVCKSDVLHKYQPQLQKDDATIGRSLAWVVIRVGLGKVIYKRAFWIVKKWNESKH